MPRRLATCAALALLAVLPACHPRTVPGAARPPRGDEAELMVYLQPMPPTALALQIESVAVARHDGPPVPLAVKLPVASFETAPRQRLLAVGRIPAGTYSGLLVGVRRARLNAGDLALPDGGGPVTVPVDVVAPAGRGQVLLLALRDEGAVSAGALLGQAPFVARRPERPAAPLLGLSSIGEPDALAVFDRRAHGVVALFPTSPQPQEVAVDDARQIAYAASAGGDRIEAFDLATFDELAFTRLRLGDRPLSLGLVPDGTLLVVANSGSESLSFVDPLAGQELQRIELRGDPVQVVIDRPGLRAFVVLRRAAAIAIVDLATRNVIRTVTVEEQPVRALVSPAGDRLTVAYARAPFLTVHSLPGGTSVGRIFAGPGVTALLRDPATGHLIVASSDATLQLFDLGTLLPVDTVPLPAPATRLAIDAAEGALLALLPARGSVAVIDLRTRRIRAEIDVGSAPRDLALVGAAR